MSTPVTVSAAIAKPLDEVWTCWTDPGHIMQWNAASDDWHCPHAENDLRVGGRFTSRMESRDGSFGFDFRGTYTAVEPRSRLAYTMEDGRICSVQFDVDAQGTRVAKTFNAENETR